MSPRLTLSLLIMLSILVGCASHKLFPADWTAYRVTQEQGRAMLQAHLSNVVTHVQGNDQSAAVLERFREETDRSWEAFVGQMHPGDELWFFSSPRESWDFLAGREGYVIVRDGKKFDTYLSRMN